MTRASASWHTARPREAGRPGAGSRRGPLGNVFHVGLASLALCCSPTATPRVVEPLRLTHIRPSNPEGVFLNEEILFYFDQELDPASITRGSVEILAESGRPGDRAREPARGDLRVESDHVRFVPAPVLAADLSDGGYLPDTRYKVTLSGFPRADGIRSARGALLQRTVTWNFATVHVDHPRTGLLFEDRMQNRSGFLRLFPSSAGRGGLIRTQDSIYLACDKPIDPSTVAPGAFQLRKAVDLRIRPEVPPESVGVRVRVVENEPEVRRRPRPPSLQSSSPPEAWEREPRACLLELTPVTRLSAGTWELRPVPEPEGSEPRLRDFGGRPVVFAESASTLRVYDPSGEAVGKEFREEFQSRRYLSPVALPGYDGTAHWGENGRVEVRYPAAAGDGSDGRVVLGAMETRSDVQGTSIDLAKDAECRLSGERGLVILRCQGRMSIQGKLSREAPWDANKEFLRDPTLGEWTPSRKKENVVTETLSAWLEGERRIGGNWTILLAGGDLEIAGTVKSTTPLLLVAGGRIRVSGVVEGTRGTVTVPAQGDSGTDDATTGVRRLALEIGGVYLLREGGGYGITPDPSPAPILLDEPQGANPLKIRLRFAALSGPIPQLGSVQRWLQPESGGSEANDCGVWRIRFLPELASLPTQAPELHSVESPALLEPPGPVQFLLELEVAPAGKVCGAWNPPWIDYVHLSWEQPQARTGQAGDDR